MFCPKKWWQDNLHATNVSIFTLNQARILRAPINITWWLWRSWSGHPIQIHLKHSIDIRFVLAPYIPHTSLTKSSRNNTSPTSSENTLIATKFNSNSHPKGTILRYNRKSYYVVRWSWMVNIFLPKVYAVRGYSVRARQAGRPFESSST